MDALRVVRLRVTLCKTLFLRHWHQTASNVSLDLDIHEVVRALVGLRVPSSTGQAERARAGPGHSRSWDQRANSESAVLNYHLQRSPETEFPLCHLHNREKAAWPRRPTRLMFKSPRVLAG